MIIEIPDERLQSLLEESLLVEDRWGPSQAKGAAVRVAKEIGPKLADDMIAAFEAMRTDSAYHQKLRDVLIGAISEAMAKKAGSIVSSMRQTDILSIIKGSEEK